MPNVSDTSVAHPSARGSNATKRLIQAAALASALIPLGAVAVEGAPITCITSEETGSGSGGCFGVTGDYTSGAGEQSNVWKFYDDYSFNNEEIVLGNLLYTFEIRGAPETTFSVNVNDEWVGINSLDYSIPFPGGVCTPLLEDEDNCVIFHVATSGQADWEDTYYIEIRWFADGSPGDSLNKPLDDGMNHIFRTEDGVNFDDVLDTELYDPNIDPIDPALGGRGNNFSSFIAGRASVPEPATLLLLGTALATALYRRRKIQ